MSGEKGWNGTVVVKKRITTTLVDGEVEAKERKSSGWAVGLESWLSIVVWLGTRVYCSSGLC